MRPFLPFFQRRDLSGLWAVLGLEAPKRRERKLHVLRNDASAIERAEHKRERIRARNLRLVAAGGTR